MHRTSRVLLATPLALLLLAGCGKGGDALAPSESTATSADEAAVQQEVALHPELVEDGLYESEAQTAIGEEAAGGVAAAIHPLFYWRQITDVERRFEFAFADSDSTGRPTTALITVHKFLHGWFNVVAGERTPEGMPIEGRVVRKRLNDHAVRRLLLKRFDVPDSRRASWKIVATSAIRITSRDAETRIESLRVQTADLDTTLTDPLALFRLRRILKLPPETEVTLTVTTLRNDDVVVLYARDRRFRFHNNGDNTYTGTWSSALTAGVHHFGVNALSHGSLFDDEAPYDSQSWILPYVTPPTELADFAP